MKNTDRLKNFQSFGKLVANTSFEKYAIDNQFIMDNNAFIEKKQGTAKFSFAFIYNNETFGVWFDYKLGKIYVSKDFIKNTPYMFSCTLQDHKDNTMFLKSAKKYSCWKTFIENFELGNVRFENMKIKNVVQNLIKSLIIS